jgi:hypothetical protein
MSNTAIAAAVEDPPFRSDGNLRIAKGEAMFLNSVVDPLCSQPKCLKLRASAQSRLQ